MIITRFKISKENKLPKNDEIRKTNNIKMTIYSKTLIQIKQINIGSFRILYANKIQRIKETGKQLKSFS